MIQTAQGSQLFGFLNVTVTHDHAHALLAVRQLLHLHFMQRDLLLHRARLPDDRYSVFQMLQPLSVRKASTSTAAVITRRSAKTLGWSDVPDEVFLPGQIHPPGVDSSRAR